MIHCHCLVNRESILPTFSKVLNVTEWAEFSPSLRRAGKTYYFPAIFETFQLVSVAKNTMLLNISPLLSRNTVGLRFIPVLDSFLFLC